MITLQELAQVTDGILHGENLSVRGCCQTDSRTVEPGDIYIARIGEATDGHKFLPQAIEKGARAAVVTDYEQAQGLVPEGFPLVVVADATQALGLIAKHHLATLRAKTPLQVVGITGSAGKTTTKDLLGQILNEAGPTVWPVGSFNNEVGLPLTVTKADENTRFLVLEMGASAAGELTYLTGLAPLDVAVELMVGTAHLGGFGGSRQAVAKAKAELLGGLVPTGAAVLNFRDDYTRAMSELLTGNQKLFFFSAEGEPDGVDSPAVCSWADDACETPDGGQRFTWHIGKESLEVNLHLVGKHNVANALAALTAAVAIGISPVQAAAALGQAQLLSPHRLAVSSGDYHGKTDLLVIDDSYNANLDSMKSALDTLKAKGEGRRLVAVLGQMLELGEQSAQIHREVAEYAAKTGVDLLITVGEDAEVMGSSFLDYLRANPGLSEGKIERHAEAVHASTASEAAKLLLGQCHSGDAILLKGSNGSGVWRVANQLLEGN